MGHINIHVIKQMSDHNSLTGFAMPSHSDTSGVCKGCALGKQHKATYPSTSSRERSKIPGALLHADLCGKVSNTSLGVLTITFSSRMIVPPTGS